MHSSYPAALRGHKGKAAAWHPRSPELDGLRAAKSASAGSGGDAKRGSLFRKLEERFPILPEQLEASVRFDLRQVGPIGSFAVLEDQHNKMLGLKG